MTQLKTISIQTQKYKPRAFFRKPDLNSEQPFFQPKITIGPVDDVYEREADDVADKVMRMEDSELQTKTSPVNIQRKCAACEEEDQIQRKEDGKNEERSEAP